MLARQAIDAVRARLDPSSDVQALIEMTAGIVDASQLLDACALAPVTVHFHPDHPLRDGRSLVEGLLDTGTYENQFASGISGGALAADAPRVQWEDALFGSTYTRCAPRDRPCYGGWNLLGMAWGACPRYGISHLRVPLAAVADRVTMCFGDSGFAPTHHGTADAFAGIVLGIVQYAHEHGHALGRPGNTRLLATRLLERHKAPGACRGGPFDYVEVQLHGPLPLDRMEAIVIDDAYSGTRYERACERLAQAHGLALERVPGPRLDPGALPDAIPGVERAVRRWHVAVVDGSTRRLARWLARRHGAGHIDAAMVGALRIDVVDRSPDVRWMGPQEVALRHVKDLMTALVVFGGPRSSDMPSR